MVIKYLDSKRLSGLSTDTTTTSYNHITDVGDNYLNLHESVNQDAVIKIISGNAVDSYIQKIKISIRKVGSPAGSFKVGIWDASDVELISVTNTANSFLTTSYVDYEFDLGTATLIDVDYKIGLQYLDGVNVSNRIDVETLDGTVESGYYVGYPDFNTNTTSRDILMSFDSTPVSLKPTSVEDNSILVEKDTGNRFWRTPALEPTFTELFTSTSAWTAATTNITFDTATDEELDYAVPSGSAANEAVSHDLGSGVVSETAWVMDYELDVTGVTQGSGASAQVVILLSDKDQTAVVDTAQDYITHSMTINSSTTSHSIRKGTGGDSPEDPVGNVLSRALQVETLYCRLKRTSATAANLSLYSDSSRSTLLESEDITVSSSVNALRYIKVILANKSGTGTHVNSGNIDNIKFYNGVTSATPATWTMNPTFEDDFTSSGTTSHTSDNTTVGGWLAQDISYTKVNGSTDVMDIDVQEDGTNDAISYDLGSAMSDSAWVLRFKMNHSARDTNGIFFFGLSDKDSVSGETTAQDVIGMRWDGYGGGTTGRYACLDTNGVGLDIWSTTEGAINSTFTLSTDYFVEIKRTSATAYTVEIFTSSDYTTGSFGVSNGVTTSDVTGLRYIKLVNMMSAHTTHSLQGTIDDVQFYNGVTSI